MAARPRLKDRLFTLLTTLAAVAVFVVGMSRGNPKLAIVGGLFFLGYGVLQSVSRRLTPAARLVTGTEADAAERRAQARATIVAGQAALAIGAVGVVLEFATGWEPGLWVAGACLLVVAVFVAALVFFGRRQPDGAGAGAVRGRA